MFAKILMSFIVVLSFLVAPTCSYASYGRSGYAHLEILGEDMYDNEEIRVQVRRHNARIVRERIEMANNFWKSFSHIKNIFLRMIPCFREDIQPDHELVDIELS